MPIDPATYQSFYDALRPAIAGTPLSRIAEQTIIFRSVGAEYNGSPVNEDAARTIFAGSKADHRWSGARPKGAGRGALYVSMHLDAVSNELFHYAGKTPTKDALAATKIFRYRVEKTLWLVDVSLASPAGLHFLHRLEQSSAVRAALGKAGYSSIRSACEAAGDYSFSRALGHALLDGIPLVDGLRVLTARNEWAKIGETGENLVLFGQDNTMIPYLAPVTETTFSVGPKPDQKLGQTVKRFP